MGWVERHVVATGFGGDALFVKADRDTGRFGFEGMRLTTFWLADALRAGDGPLGITAGVSVAIPAEELDRDEKAWRKVLRTLYSDRKYWGCREGDLRRVTAWGIPKEAYDAVLEGGGQARAEALAEIAGRFVTGPKAEAVRDAADRCMDEFGPGATCEALETAEGPEPGQDIAQR